MALLLGFAALVATLLGGGFALRYQDKLHLILGFSAGAVYLQDPLKLEQLLLGG